MRRLLTLLLVMLTVLANAAPVNHYIDNKATGLNNGSSWANAWTNVDQVAWNVVLFSDTIWISGGPDGGTNSYFGNFTDQFGSPNSGIFGSPIRVAVSQELGHNGKVKIWGDIFLSRDYWVVDGRKDTNSVPVTAFDVPNYTRTNCNIEVYNTNKVGNGVYFQGTGSKIMGIHVSLTTNDDAGIYIQDGGAGHGVGTGTEIAYNWLSDIWGFGLRGEYNVVVSDDFGQLSAHHNFMERVHDNFMQFSSWVDYYDNYCTNHPVPPKGHPDCVQEVLKFSRVFNNVNINNQGSRFYVESSTTLAHDIYCYNNLYYVTTNYFGQAYQQLDNGAWATNYPGTGFDITGHDDFSGQPMNLSNIFIFNNTFLLRGYGGVATAGLVWGNGSTANPRDTNSWVTNIFYANNNVIGMAPENTSVALQFSTNLDLFNGFNGWAYTEPQVIVDYNSLNGFSGSGKGIQYGNKGSHTAGAINYTNMAEFALDTRYKSNNNAVAVYVNTNGYDFRPQVSDQALYKWGTNLTTLLSATAPYMTNDIMGVPRQSPPTVGAFEVPLGAWVATNGNDANAGTFSAPWRTIQKAVNTATAAGTNIFVTPGDYNEYVETVANGTSAARIRICAYPANDPSNPVTTRQFRVKHQYITIEGFTLTKAVGINNAMIRIEAGSASYNGSDCIVTNNTIKDGVFLISSNATFGNDFIQIGNATEGVDFNSAGFVPGMQVYLGSDSVFTYTNHGLTPTIASISGDGKTMHFTTSLSADSGTYWTAVLAGGDGPTSWKGVMTTIPDTGYPGCSNIVVVGNTFSNLIGIALMINQGNSNLITGNKMTRLHGGYGMQIQSRNTEVSWNSIIDSRNIEYFTSRELSDPNIHPAGGGFYDFWCQLTTTGPIQGLTNIDFHHNWIQNCGNQMQEWNSSQTSSNVTVRYCVYVGVYGAGGVSMNGITFDHCTFVRNTFDQDSAHILGLGANPNYDNQVAETNLTLTSNAMINNGGHANLSQEAPFSMTSITNLVCSNNYSVFSETMGWTNTPALAGTFGSNDPVLVNISNPLGPDGLPFTDDDGLRPLPNSPLAIYGIGALTPLSSQNPVAHFSVILPSPSWQDKTGTNYDTAWWNLKPHQRTDAMRPWQTPELLTSNASVTVTLDASKSIDGLGTNNTAITNYTWTFSDGGSASGSSPTTSHTFSTGGTNWVTLTVTAPSGTSTYSNSYRLLGSGADPSISVQPQNQIVTAPATATFSVTASGNTTLSYQWSRAGTNVAGATQSNYTTPATAVGDNGQIFYVTVTDTAGSLQSANATLTVNAPGSPSTISSQRGSGKFGSGRF